MTRATITLPASDQWATTTYTLDGVTFNTLVWSGSLDVPISLTHGSCKTLILGDPVGSNSMAQVQVSLSDTLTGDFPIGESSVSVTFTVSTYTWVFTMRNESIGRDGLGNYLYNLDLVRTNDTSQGLYTLQGDVNTRVDGTLTFEYDFPSQLRLGSNNVNGIAYGSNRIVGAVRGDTPIWFA